MAYLADLIMDRTPTGSSGLPVDYTGSIAGPAQDPADECAPPYGLVVRPIGGPFPVTFAEGALTISGSIDADNSEVTASIEQQTQDLLAVLTSSEQKLCDLSSSINGVIDGSLSFTVAAEKSLSASFMYLSASNSTVVFASASSARKMLTVFNDSSRRSLYIYLGPGASTDVFTVRVPPQGYYELPHPVYTGEVTGYWVGTPEGLARITELF